MQSMPGVTVKPALCSLWTAHRYYLPNRSERRLQPLTWKVVKRVRIGQWEWLLHT